MSEPGKVTLLAGGIGGSRMAEGFAALDSVELTVIGNIADDDEFHGLWVSPDIDTMIYTLSGRIDRNQGWGVADEGCRAINTLAELGAATWMFLGDRDFGLHIYRTERLRKGDRPTEITFDIADRLGCPVRVVLPTDDTVQTRVKTADGWLSFQRYFVENQHSVPVEEVLYEGIENAKPTPEALTAIAEADLIVFAPSNPVASISPILAIPGITDALSQVSAPIIAISPIIGGKVMKGAADAMMRGLGLRADALGVAEYYAGLARTFLIDTADAWLSAGIADLGLRPVVTDILMPDIEGKKRLARQVLECSAPASWGI
ncbi:MAG: 2-phospho-L-lactate transferase [Rhodobacteraceae bacterium]|nr:2-phospho-L-lactate transferase [Paracoccaceae bacterium]